MAISAATATSDFSGYLNPVIAAPIFERAARQSVVQRLVRQVPLGGNGVSIPFVSGRPSVAWVDEAGQKPASSGSMTLKTLTPKKTAAILVVSAEVVRANPGDYINTMRDSLAEAFANAFDLAALHDQGPDGSAGAGPFATYIDQTTKSEEIGTTAAADGGIAVDLALALGKIVESRDASNRPYRCTGWAIDAVLEPSLWGAVDSTGQPLFRQNPALDPNAMMGTGSLMNRPSFMGEGVATWDDDTVVGYGGDWSQAAWGVVGGISYDVSTEATVTINGTLTSLWEHNLMAIRAEAEYGFVVADTAAFVKLTNTNNSPATSA